MNIKPIIVTADNILDQPPKVAPPMPDTIACHFPEVLQDIVKIKYEGTTYINRRFVTD